MGAAVLAIARQERPREPLVLDPERIDDVSALDPSSSLEGTTSRMALDATRSPGFEGPRIELSPESMARARSLIAGLDTE